MKRVLMQGTLEKVRLASLVQALLSDGLEGTLEVETRVATGWLTLQAQRIGDGALGRLTGVDAAVALLMPMPGSFILYDETRSAAWTIQDDPLALLLESLRLSDLWTAVAHRKVTGKQGAPEGTPLAACLERGLTPEQAASELGLHPLEVLRSLGPLLETFSALDGDRSGAPIAGVYTASGAVEASASGAPGPAAGPAPSPERSGPSSRFYELLEAGRRVFREGKLREAEDLFLQARELDPENRTLQQNLRVLALKLQLQEDSESMSRRRAGAGGLLSV